MRINDNEYWERIIIILCAISIILAYHKFPENFANIINTRIKKENQMLIRKKF